jgi:hypothetical protein
MKKDNSTTTVAEILGEHSLEVRLLAERLRQIVRQEVPEAIEKAYAYWHGIGYTHPESGYFAAIFPQYDRVKLGFEFGILLPDPDGLLRGEGKQVRYVHLHDLETIPEDKIRQLLQAAIDLPSSREIKMGLVHSAARPTRK